MAWATVNWHLLAHKCLALHSKQCSFFYVIAQLLGKGKGEKNLLCVTVATSPTCIISGVSAPHNRFLPLDQQLVPGEGCYPRVRMATGPVGSCAAPMEHLGWGGGGVQCSLVWFLNPTPAALEAHRCFQVQFLLLQRHHESCTLECLCLQLLFWQAAKFFPSELEPHREGMFLTVYISAKPGRN